jgi:hypothetical protein
MKLAFNLFLTCNRPITASKFTDTIKKLDKSSSFVSYFRLFHNNLSTTEVIESDKNKAKHIFSSKSFVVSFSC